MQFLNDFLYYVIATSIFIVIYFYFRFKVHRIEKLKLKSLRKREISDAIDTESPVDDSEQEVRDIGISGIEGRFSFIQKILPAILFLVWLVAMSLPNLGKVPSIYISLIAAIASVLVGIALRPFLENLFAGVVISFFRSIRIGDTVIIDGHYGIIEDIGFTNTILKKWDWNRIVIPNSRMLQKEIQNMTVNDHFIWAHVEFYVSPDTPIDLVESIAKHEASLSRSFDPIEEPSFWVMELEKDSVKCWIAAWATSPANAWNLKNDIRTGIIKEFQKNNISFHMHQFSNIQKANI